jgi:septum formation protein
MLILASDSPRRKQLLSLGGWEFDVFSPDVDESVLTNEAAAEYVLRVARQKAFSVMSLLEVAAGSDRIILAADTAVVAPHPTEQGSASILGKPADDDEAVEMLSLLRGQTHQVYTGLAAVRLRDQLMLTVIVSTDVEMRRYTDQEIMAYVASGDPRDKAGAYAIQNKTFQPVQNLQGCFANVMGLPVCHVAQLLEKLGNPPSTEIFRACEQALDFRCEIYSQILLL